MAPPASPRLRLAFLGTPDFAVPTLAALASAGHEIACVYTQPPRPARRGQKPRPTAVQEAAEARGWPLRSPTRLTAPAEQEAFHLLALDCAVVVAYGLLLPAAILAAPRLGCVNVHASLLPRWRGAAPIQRAILAGDRVSGITIMQMDAGLDTGPILLQEELALTPEITAGQLHDRLAALGATLAVRALAGLAAGTLEARPQPRGGATYAAKIGRDETRLDWRAPAERLERQVRAFAPAPGAYAVVPGPKGAERLKVLAVAAVARRQPGPPGRVLAAAGDAGGLCVACADGCLELQLVQRQGRAAMSGAELLRGFAIPPGLDLPLPEPEP